MQFTNIDKHTFFLVKKLCYTEGIKTLEYIQSTTLLNRNKDMLK